MNGRLTASHDELLSRLERLEMGWLSWGRVDGSITEAEALQVAAEVGGGADAGDELINDLLDTSLLLDVGGAERVVRTRFAESVRLLVRNRQLLHTRPWRNAAQLVNDFRVLARPRLFPRRDVTFAQLVASLGTDGPLAAGEQRALEGMLSSGSGTLALSQFQLDATRRIRRELAASRQSATVISAGTGSGKTKAFYLPVLAAIAAQADPTPWARVLAIYPRNELLKDQLTEALAQVELVAANGGPTLAVGALFGPTMANARAVAEDARRDHRGWVETANGFACRYLRCPRGCSQDLVWGREEWARAQEIVGCPNCGWRSRPAQVVLTRERLRAGAPHVLFTTTEMLNRGLADAQLRGMLVGVTAAQRPRVLLLDEIHTYGGVHGAQVALLIRRWRHALGRSAPLHVVGLSATLEGPIEFLRALTGITDVEEVSPREEDIVAASAEYALVLRGNPVSGTALLSTTIQTAFLLTRLLEARDLRDRTGTSGSRVFAFTDNLDVTNRLYWDLRDAEQTPRGPLAALRAAAADGDAVERDEEGQIWRLAPLLGWPLTAANRLRVTRTSSQDAGVDPTSDVIVATSSLEVGFDDPEVGAVVQHKAPRDDAAFIQRKGRAGRRPEMRPWTVVVLSDYGRDRARYQAYESLFAPVLQANALPIDNLHVIKMQAALALLDWLTPQVPGLRARADLSAGRDGSGTPRARRQLAVAAILRSVLEDPRRELELERHVRQALGLSAEETLAVMWTQPRDLMTGVIPTFLRRIEANWTTASGGADGPVWDAPLPEHAPRALFSDLNLPEVTVRAPHRQANRPDREERLSVVQAVSEFVPGRASRRFGVAGYSEWHWVPLVEAADGAPVCSDVTTWITQHAVEGELCVPGESVRRPLLRPWTMQLELTPRAKQSSNARPRWLANIERSGPPWVLAMPLTSSAARVVSELAFHTHALGNEAQVARGVASVAAESPDGIETDVELVGGDDGHTPVALGFTARVDAVHLAVRPGGLPRFADLSPAAKRAIRKPWFEQSLVSDAVIRAKVSGFTAGWISALYLASVAGIAMAENSPTLEAAIRRVEALGTQRCMERALEAVFVAAEASEESASRGIGRLLATLADGDVIARVEALGQRLSGTPTEALDTHTLKTAVSTVAAAIREAFQRMAPTFDAESLVIDIDEQADPRGAVIDVWLCEPDVGSGGTIEELRRRTNDEPGRLVRLVSAALGPTDLELVDANVRRALDLAQVDPGVNESLAAVRAAVTADASTRAQYGLRATLRSNGISTDHSVLSTLNLRVLRPGSGTDTDQALLRALRLWDDVEGRLGIELDARSVAYAISRSGTLTLEQTYSLLWPRGRDARAAGLDAYSRFSRPPAPDRLTLQDVLTDRVMEVAAGPECNDKLRHALASTGSARLTATVGQEKELQMVLLEVLTQAIDVGSVSGHPRVVGAARQVDVIAVTLELPEAAQ